MLDIAKLQAMGVEESRKTRFDLGEELSDVLITFEQKIDQDYMDSVSMNLLQIGELAGKFSDAYVQKTKPQMDWRAIKNMRNMFAHDYGSMDKDRSDRAAGFQRHPRNEYDRYPDSLHR